MTASALVGHAAVLERLESDFAQQKLAHAYLISGPKGIGKATLAKHFASHILAADDLFGGSAARIESGAHAGLLVIERATDPKTGEPKRDIVIEQAREIGEFFAFTAGEGTYRVVIIDAIDEMNANASNAILKILEEPPPRSLLMLISHHPGKLLPTIRSRCQMLKCAPLSLKNYQAVMRRIMPDVDDETIATLGKICEYAPSVAQDYYLNGAHILYEQLKSLFEGLPIVAPDEVMNIAKWVGAGAQAKAKWPIFTGIVLQLIATRAKAERDLAEAQFWAEKWAEAGEVFSATERLSLDYGAVIISFLHSLSSKQPFALTA